MKVKCPKCGEDFYFVHRGTNKVKSLLYLFENCHVDFSARSVIGEIKKYPGWWVSGKDRRSMWNTLESLRMQGFVAKRKIGANSYWRITRAGVDYLRLHGLISEKRKRKAQRLIEKREEALLS